MSEGNVYYSPEKLGLKILKELSEDLSYEFNIFLVLQDTEGNLYTTSDSGCSCPTPFETYTSIEDLDRHPDADSVVQAAARWGAEGLEVIELMRELKEWL